MLEFLKGSDEKLRQGCNKDYDYLRGAYTRLGIPDPAIDLKEPKEAFDAALTAAQAPNHTKADTLHKRRTKKVVKDAYRKYANENLVHNPKLTDNDIVELQLHVDKTPAQKPVPITIPIIVAIVAVFRQVTFRCYTKPSGKRVGKDPDADAFVVYWALLDHEPTSLAELINRSSTTGYSITLDFAEADRGKTLYYVGCWQIDRDRLEGPKTLVAKVIVP
jgi:hypothetical protein